MERQFLVIHSDNRMTLVDEEQVSNLIDMSDCYEPFTVWTLQDGGLVKVEVGKMVRIKTDEEHPFIYGASTLLLPDGTVVGHVKYTDH